MTVQELYTELEKANKEGVEKFGVIVYKEGNWPVTYSRECRSYKVSSNCRRFKAEAIANSMFGDSLDGSDRGVRLDAYDWEVEDCYMLD